MITETLHIRGNLPNLGGREAHNTTLQSESRMETLEPRTPIVHPKTQLRIGNWNVRTLYAQEKAAQAAKAMREAKLQIMGISESRWCGSGKFILSTGETIVYSGRDDDFHQHGVAIMLSKDAAKALINWTPIDERIIRARFHSRYVKLTMIHVYAPTNDTDEEVKDHFYEKLQAVVEKNTEARSAGYHWRFERKGRKRCREIRKNNG